MTATRTTRRISRRTRATRKSSAARRTAKPQSKAPAKPLSKLAARLVPPPQVHFRLCRPGWAVIVDKVPNVQGTRFVCPFCPLSHRVPGPVRGFRKFRRAQWVKLRRVEE